LSRAPVTKKHVFAALAAEYCEELFKREYFDVKVNG
jgi:hypothetical protein